MPQLGETVTEGTITKWFKQVGDAVAEDEVLFEVSTDKVDSEVPSPVAGVLTEILVPEGDTVEVGKAIAVVSEDGAAAAPAAAPTAESGSAEAPAPAEAPPPPPAAAPPPPPPAAEAAPPPPPPPAAPPPPPPPPPAAPAAPPAPAAAEAGDGDGRVLSPIVRRLMAEHGLDASTVQGTGVAGRITRSDVERAIQARGPAPAAPGAAPAPAPATTGAAAEPV